MLKIFVQNNYVLPVIAKVLKTYIYCPSKVEILKVSINESSNFVLMSLVCNPCTIVIVFPTYVINWLLQLLSSGYDLAAQQRSTMNIHKDE